MFLPFKKTDIISSHYTAYPSYNFILSGANASSGGTFKARGQEVYLFVSGSEDFTRERIVFDANGNRVTSSVVLSGAITYTSAPTTTERYSLNRLRGMYASASFLMPHMYTSASVSTIGSASTAGVMTVSSSRAAFINIPSILYGSEIKPGSFSSKFTYGASGASRQVHSYYDNGYGGIFSGARSDVDITHKLVGCIFYQHGIVFFGGQAGGGFGYISSSISCSFSGTHKIPVNIYHCNVKKGALNFSNNSSYTVYSSASNSYEITTKKPKTFITGVGLYDENFRLLGVIKLGTPVLNEENTSIVIKGKLHF